MTEALSLDDLSAKTRAILDALKVQVVNMVDRRGAPDDKVSDTQEQIIPFMRDKDIAAMLVQPDLYLFGGASDAKGLEALIYDLDSQARDLGFARDEACRRP